MSASPSRRAAHRFAQNVCLSHHVLGAAFQALHLLHYVKGRIEPRLLSLTALHRSINVIVPFEVAGPPRQDVDMEVWDSLSSCCAILHGELQTFGSEAASDGATHKLRKLPHITDLSG
jgi:hypothetical protein